MIDNDALLSRALDEIYALRAALAYEASRTSADLDMKSYPKSRRAIAEQAIERMQAAARGQAARAYAGKSSTFLKHSLREAGASETLTLTEWTEGKL